MQKFLFRLTVTWICTVIEAKNWILGRSHSDGNLSTDQATATRHQIASGENLLDAVFVEPAAEPMHAVVLICHGIGETVQRWLPVQQLLAANGTASLVFDYSGYGRSSGQADWKQFELDAVSAFGYLQTLAAGQRVSILGFSLGSGIAAAIAQEVEAASLVMCAAFTSFREAACSTVLPRGLAFLAPAIWKAEDSLLGCSLPVLIVHGAKDRLFPVRMAAELAGFCGEDVELLIVPELRHNEPFRQPRQSYWGEIVSRLVQPGVVSEPASLLS
jgi:alpha-beta hydrolase superfamily lysophospholipase